MKVSRRQPPTPKSVNPIWRCKYLMYCCETCLVSAPFGNPNRVTTTVWNGLERSSDGLRIATGAVGSGTLTGANFLSPVQVLDGGKPFTAFWRCPVIVDSFDRNGGSIMSGGGNGYACYFGCERNINSTRVGISFSENYSTVRGITFTFTESQPLSSYFFIYDGSNVKMYQNNIEVNGTNVVNIGNPSSVGYLYAAGDIVSYSTVEPTTMVGWFPYAMNGSQREELSYNPWGLFQERSWMYTGVGSGGNYTPITISEPPSPRPDKTGIFISGNQ